MLYRPLLWLAMLLFIMFLRNYIECDNDNQDRGDKWRR